MVKLRLMIDKLREFAFGSFEERQAGPTLRRLSRKKVLNHKDQEDLKVAQGLSRRLFLKQGSLVVGGTAGVGTGGFGLLKFLFPDGIPTSSASLAGSTISPDNDDEAVYERYLNAFEAVAAGDNEASKILGFFKARRRKGYLSGDLVIADESGEAGTNFYTAIVHPIRNRQVFQRMQGFAQYNSNTLPQRLLLRDVPVTSLFAGVMAAHEGLHVYQDLMGIERSRPDGFMLGEQEAYELEFRLLNKATGGRFKEVLRQQVPNIEANKYRGKLSDEDYMRIAGLFEPYLSQDEEGIRIPIYILALNFEAAQMRATSPEEAKQSQVNYMRDVFSGQIPLLPLS